MVFLNRVAAGRELAERLADLAGLDLVVLGLPRGGVPVAFEVAEALGAPLDVIVVRKVGVPFQRELAMGAVGEGGVRVVNERVRRAAGVGPDEFAAAAAREQAEVDRRTRRFRSGRPPLPIDGRIAVVVDDGIATGATARAACQVARAQGAARVVLAVPVSPRDTAERMRDVADEVVCLREPRAFGSVGAWYRDFGQISDAEVAALLELGAPDRQPAAAGSASAADPAAADPPDPPARDEQITVPVGGLRLAGRLTVPDGARRASVPSPRGQNNGAVVSARASARVWRGRGSAGSGAGCTTVTGQCACSTHCMLTDPSTRPRNPPCPRDPTTSRSQSVDLSTSARGAGSAVTTGSSTRPSVSIEASTRSNFSRARRRVPSSSSGRRAPYGSIHA